MSCAAMPAGFLKKSFPTKSEIGSPMLLNILATSANPQTCARNLDNRTLETQILAVSMLLSRYAKDCTYGINRLFEHVPSNHPFMRWLFNDEANIDWLKEYAVLLQVEYAGRTSHAHASRKDIFDFVGDFRPSVGLEPKAFMNRAWDELFDYSDIKDVHQAYRDLLSARWTIAKTPPRWGDRMPPIWYLEYQLERGCPDKRVKKIGDLDGGEKVVAFTVTDGAGGRGRISYTEGLRGGCEVH